MVEHRQKSMEQSGQKRKLFQIFPITFLLLIVVICQAKDDKKENSDSDEKWKKKDVRDYSDADLERLYEQWEEDDDPLEEDELPEWKKPQPKIDLSKIDMNDPEGMLKMSKQGRTLMMFATVSGNPAEKETDKITQLWHSSLFNANYEVQRYVVGSDRALFMLKDGSKAWEVKEFLVSQERCALVTIEGKDYPGKGSNQQSKDENKAQKKSSPKAEKSKKKKKDTEESKKEREKSHNEIKKPKVEL